MNKQKNIIVAGKHEKPITVDIYWNDSAQNQSIVLFAHGFKGFKDWGHWEEVAKAFVAAGHCFVKFNFSHNGVTPDDLLNFADLEAFGHNNYIKELDDLQVVIDWLSTPEGLDKKINWDTNNITLVGHSRGGPIVLIAANENINVQRVVTWAGVHELNYPWANQEEHVENWKKEGVYHIMNGRTKQNMPLYYQLYENYMANEARLSIQKTLGKLDKPYLILHGTKDPAVPLEAAYYLSEHAQNATLVEIEGADHVFGGKHPFVDTTLPPHSQKLVDECIEFIQEH
ncbi:MAG: alpha/beta hydrolase [Aureispira sp.]|nr:alpha/beta hydrolase [Aureispira sp.]